MSARFDINIIVFLAPVGALVVIITRAGGSKAYGELMNRKLKSRRGASLATAALGDHCSPISDTTIMASAGAGCDHISHVSTRIPYCLTVAACCCAGYIAGGFTGGNRIVTFGAGVVSLLASLKFLHAKYGA